MSLVGSVGVEQASAWKCAVPRKLSASVTYIIGIWLLSALTATAAECTPDMVANLRARGASAELISRLCPTGSAGGQRGAPQSTVCVTSVGVCAYAGTIGDRCTCPGPTGMISGTAR